MHNAWLDESQVGIKILSRWRKYQQPHLCRWYHSTSRKWRGTNEPLDDSEKVGLKLNVQITKILASGPITSCQTEGEKVVTVIDFLSLGSKITGDGDSSHEIKSYLILGRRVMTHLDRVLKSRDLNLWMKVHLVKTIAFPVVMYWCESWTIKMAECWRIDAFELWCWRRLLRVPWTARRSNQSILKEINSEYWLEGLMLKLQYFGHLMWRAYLLEKIWCWERLKARGEGGDKRWDGWMPLLTQWTWMWANSRS